MITLTEVQHAAATVSIALGAVYSACTVIGNPLSRVSNTRLASFGHLVLAFGADMQKAQKRLVELFSSSESV